MSSNSSAYDEEDDIDPTFENFEDEQAYWSGVQKKYLNNEDSDDELSINNEESDFHVDLMEAIDTSSNNNDEEINLFYEKISEINFCRICRIPN
mgnify:CR=1 FL=1